MNYKLNFLFCFIILMLTSCGKDVDRMSSNEGILDINISAMNNTVDVSSRTSPADVPDVSSFGLELKNSENVLVKSWESFSDFAPVTIAVDRYAISAYYGDLNKEGFDALSYYGSTEVQIIEGQKNEASIECSINKALVSIFYTDEFKKYFSDYKAYIETSVPGTKIEYSKTEDRSAYFLPGNLRVYLLVKRNGVKEEIKLNPKNFSAAAKTEYRLTMDVDASTSTLKIIFNDNPSSKENVEINISDESLNAEPPVAIPFGFESDVEKEVLEASSIDEKLQVIVNAQAGISSCTMEIQSDYLKSLGWPESLELTSLSPEHSTLLSSSNLSLKGFGENKDRMAFVDFASFVPNLACMADGDDVHTFKFVVTDILTKVSEPVVLKIKTRNNHFSFTGQELIPYSSSEVNFDMTLEGNVQDVTFEEFISDSYVKIDPSRINITPEEGTINSKVKINFPSPLVDTESEMKIRASICAGCQEVKFRVDAPELTLSLKNGDADVWATKAYLNVAASAKSRASRTISSNTVEIQYKNGENWEKWPNQSYDEKTGFLLTGLTHNTQYTVRAVYYVNSEVASTSAEVSFTTEEMKQLLNNKFQNWTKENGQTEHYSIWSLEGWSTMNLLTTSEGGTNDSNFSSDRNGMAYCATSGTINASEGFDDSSAALIRSVGWGKGSSAGWGSAGMKKTTAGELFLGTYDLSTGANYGILFESRPKAVSFYYKYIPKNPNDKFIVEVNLYDVNGEVITTGTLDENDRGASGNYIKRTVILDYSNNTNKKCSKLSLRFVSGTYLGKNSTDFNVSGSLAPDKTFEYVGSQLYIDNVELIYE